MYAVVANGIQTIARNQRHLDYILSVYPYPKFQVCRTEEQAYEWIRRNQRGFKSSKIWNYGDTGCTGYATIRFKVDTEHKCVNYEIETKHLGHVRIAPKDKDVSIDNRRDRLLVNISDFQLDDSIIQHHVLAIRRILLLIGEFVDVNIVVHDLSTYLALSKYRGKDQIICSAQQEIRKRLGAVSYTVEEEAFDNK